MATRVMSMKFDGKEFQSQGTALALNIEEIARNFKELEQLGLPEHLMRSIGDYLIKNIRNVTKGDNIDAGGISFTQYARSYKKAGRPVDLYDTGRGLDNMYADVNGTSIGINFEPYMDYHQTGSGNLPQRRFFPDEAEDFESGPHSDTNDFIENIIENYIENALNIE